MSNCFKSLKLNPNHAMTHYVLGNALNGLGKKEEAIESYRKAIEIDPNFK